MEGVVLFDGIEQMGPDTFFAQLRDVPAPHRKRLSLRANSPYESATFDLKSRIYEAIRRFCILAGSYCSDVQKWPFGIGGVAFPDYRFLQVL